MFKDTLLKEVNDSTEGSVNTEVLETDDKQGPGTASSGTTAGGSSGPAKSMVIISDDATING